MNDSAKVVRYGLDGFDGLVPRAEGGYVTHADYKALEEERDRAVRNSNEAENLYNITARDLVVAREELASLKARVGELVEASSDMADMAEQIKRTGGVSTARFNDRSIRLKSAIGSLS
jgi:hypothetical protein